eukprot:8346955-Alexandrium_andersonii.AAC.1
MATSSSGCRRRSTTRGTASESPSTSSRSFMRSHGLAPGIRTCILGLQDHDLGPHGRLPPGHLHA